MIKITEEKLGLNIVLDGDIKEIPTKINHNEIISIYGFRFTESARSVIDIQVNISYLDEQGYKDLQDIFLYSRGNIIVENLDKGRIYKNYYINGNTMSLDEYEDMELRNYYYKGTLLLNKI